MYQTPVIRCAVFAISDAVNYLNYTITTQKAESLTAHSNPFSCSHGGLLVSVKGGFSGKHLYWNSE